MMPQMDEDTREKMVKIFGRFMFAEVPMVEEKRTMKVAGKKMTFEEVRFADPDHAVLRDLKRTAEECGMRLRVWFPGMVATMEFDSDRLNVHIEKSTDGKWRISERMNLDASPAILRTMSEIIERGLDTNLQVRKPFRLKALTP